MSLCATSSGGNQDCGLMFTRSGCFIFSASATRRPASDGGNLNTATSFLLFGYSFQKTSSLSYGTLTSIPNSSTLVFAVAELSAEIFVELAVELPALPAILLQDISVIRHTSSATIAAKLTIFINSS